MKVPLAILGLGPGEIILILVVLLIVFGASRLPQIGSSLGKSLKNFRSGLKEEQEDKTNPPKSLQDKKPSHSSEKP